MIRLIESLNYRSLRYVRQPLQDFHVLIGPNASGKTTFLDTIGFLSDLLTSGLDVAITARSNNIRDLFFFQEGTRFELATEIEIPEICRVKLGPDCKYDLVRYEIAVGINEESDEYQIFDEQVILCSTDATRSKPMDQRALFPAPIAPPRTSTGSR